MSDVAQPYIVGFAAGVVLGGGGVGLLAGVWFGWTVVVAFFQHYPQAEGAVIGGIVATVAFSVVLAVVETDEEGSE